MFRKTWLPEFRSMIRWMEFEVKDDDMPLYVHDNRSDIEDYFNTYDLYNALILAHRNAVNLLDQIE